MIDKNFSTTTKVVGVTKFNENNYPIQPILQNLSRGDKLFFIRDYSNRFDENAIKVYAWCEKELLHIGYISKELASNISPFLDENSKFDLDGVVKEITGGLDGKSYGCNIEIWINDPNEPDYWEAKAFADWMRNKSQQSTDENISTNYETKTSNKKIIKDNSFSVAITVFALAAIVVIMSLIPMINDSGNSNSSSSALSNSNENNYDNAYFNNSSSSSSHITPVKMTDIDIEYNILPPNSINVVYMEAKYRNNSNLTITHLSLKVLLKDKNDITFLSCSDTVLPGATSYNFDSFGPDSCLNDDVEFLKCSLTVVDLHKGEIHIDYDYRLNTYEIW